MLVTELRAPGALVRLTDDLPLRSGADLDEDAPAGCGELLRLVEVLEGPRGSDLDHAARGRGARELDRLTAPFELWTRAPVPEGRAHWRDALSRCAEAGATGVLVPFDARLLDLLRNPDAAEDRSDLTPAQG